MTNEQVIIGMKVVPHSKNAGSKSSDSINLKMAKDIGQIYLYVTGRDLEMTDWFVLNFKMDDYGAGDYFLASDFEPYINYIRKKKLKKLNKNTSF